ncbi:unnamed protein product [Dracunculus medinensis]|uniref:Cytochrome b561 domain-containing protein n=1 Tax=Dracunculus medinensis TaxID=318479 RepID=A0A0N4UQ78_DRAME|nr:unnamed protein product [Dracunculus medinensis]
MPVGHTLERNLSYGSIHSLVGVLSVILAVMQPFGSLLRCAPDNRYRPIFNWSHLIAVIFFKTFINHRFVACLLLALYIATIVIFITASEVLLCF